jgi:hypothetical protein
MCGVRTNIVTAVEIRDKDASDTKLLPDLVDATAKNFTLNEVSQGLWQRQELQGRPAPRCYALHRLQKHPYRPLRGPMAAHVPSVPIQPRRIFAALPQAQQRRVHLLNDQGQVPRSRPQQNRRGDEKRSALQDHLPQHLLSNPRVA